MIVCKKCGRVLNEEDISCPLCGTPTAEAPQYNFFSTEQRNEQPPDAPPGDPYAGSPTPNTAPDAGNVTPPPNTAPNVSYVTPPPQYGYAPPPDAPPQCGYAPPPGAQQQYDYTPPQQHGYTAPQGYRNNAAPYNNSGIYVKKPKSKIAAGLLAILLGYGIYNFYLKYYVKAVIQLAGTIIASGFIVYWSMGFAQEIVQMSMEMAMDPYAFSMPDLFAPSYIIGSIISTGIWLWSLVEGILILIGRINTDGAGGPIA